MHADVDHLPSAATAREKARDHHVQFATRIHPHRAGPFASIQHPIVAAAGEHSHPVQSVLRVGPGQADLEVVEPFREAGRPVGVQNLARINPG